MIMFANEKFHGNSTLWQVTNQPDLIRNRKSVNIDTNTKETN